MRAVLQTGVRKVEVVELADPQPTHGRVVVDMRAAGICGSDLHGFRRERGAERAKIPHGHEPCGVVSSLGEGVTHLAVGDRVTVYHYESCGHCQHCRQGNWMWCRNREERVMGHTRPGSCADRVLIDARNCFVLPDELTFAEGAFIACGAGTVWSSMRKCRPTAEDVAVVFGLGPIGLLGVLFMKAFGATVIAVGRRASRLALARELGASLVLDIDEVAEPSRRVMDAYPNGATLAFETSGSAAAQKQMLASLGRFGRAVCVGLGSREPAVNLNSIHGNQLTLYGSYVMNAGEYDALAEFIAGNSLELDRLVSHRFRIEEAQRAFDTADTGDCTKVMFVWD